MGEEFRIGIESLANFIAEQLSPNVLSDILRDSLLNEVKSYVHHCLNTEVENLISTIVKKEVESLRQQCNLALENLANQLQETLSALKSQNSPSYQKDPIIKSNQNPLLFTKPNIPEPLLSQSISITPDSSSDNYSNFSGSQQIPDFSNPADRIKEYFRFNNYTEGFKLLLDNDSDKVRQECLSFVNFENINKMNLDLITAERLCMWAVANYYQDFLTQLVCCVDNEVLRKLLRKIVALKDPSFNNVKSAIIKILG